MVLLRLMASMLATDAAIKKISFGAETTLKVSNKGLNDFMKIVEESGLKKNRNADFLVCY